MANVEVAQEQLEALQRSNALLSSLLDDPKNGLTIKRIIKDKYPTARTPDLDIIEQVTKPYDEKFNTVQSALEKISKDFSDYRTTVETKEAEGQLRTTLDRIRTENHFTDEGMAAVIDAMKTRNLAHDPEAAAALVLAKQPKAAPMSVRNSMLGEKLDVFGLNSRSAEIDKQWQDLQSNPWNWFDNQVVEVIDEFNRQAA